MPLTAVPAVTLTPVGYFPEKYFLENLHVRADGSVLITAVLQKELWCVPGPQPSTDVPPVRVHTIDHLVSGIVEAEPDVFIICLSDVYTTHESHLVRIDFNGWTPGKPVSPEIGHDPSIWLTGWYPGTLAMQLAAVTAAGAGLDRYWAAGTAPVLEIIAALDPFHQPKQWDDLRAQLQDSSYGMKVDVMYRRERARNQTPDCAFPQVTG